jgi:predicted transcriptional regulator
MPRKKAASLTGREAQIMDVLWRQETATAEEVRALLPGEPHDSTVRTLLRVMEQKGLVAHKIENRTYVYRAVIGQTKIQRKAIKGLIQQLFGGSARNLVLQLLDDDEISLEELQRLAGEVQPKSKPSRKRGSP